MKLITGRNRPKQSPVTPTATNPLLGHGAVGMAAASNCHQPPQITSNRPSTHPSSSSCPCTAGAWCCWRRPPTTSNHLHPLQPPIHPLTRPHHRAHTLLGHGAAGGGLQRIASRGRLHVFKSQVVGYQPDVKVRVSKADRHARGHRRALVDLLGRPVGVRRGDFFGHTAPGPVLLHKHPAIRGRAGRPHAGGRRCAGGFGGSDRGLHEIAMRGRAARVALIQEGGTAEGLGGRVWGLGFEG